MSTYVSEGSCGEGRTLARDAFSALPVELLCMVLSNVECRWSGLPLATGLHYIEVLSGKLHYRDRGNGYLHPLLALASASRTLRDAVEGHCRNKLLQHARITKFKGFTAKSKAKDRSVKSHRGIWCRFIRRKCAFCGSVTDRSAIFNCLINCCRACDRREWPSKIVRMLRYVQRVYGLTRHPPQVLSQIKSKYKLEREDLVNLSRGHLKDFPPQADYSWPGAHVEFLEAWPSEDLKTLRHAVYVEPGALTTMFLENEVQERARVMWGERFSDGAVHPKRKGEVSNGGLKGGPPRKRQKPIRALGADAG